MLRRLSVLWGIFIAAYAAAAMTVDGWNREFSPYLGKPLDGLAAAYGPYNNSNPVISQYYWENIRFGGLTLSVVAPDDGAAQGHITSIFMVRSLGDHFLSCRITTPGTWSIAFALFSCGVHLKA